MEEGVKKFKVKHRYEGRAVSRYYDRDAEKGDAEFIPWDSRPDTVNRVRFYLEDVVTWEVHSDPHERYDIQDKKEVLEVGISGMGGIRIYHIIESLEVFDLLIEETEYATEI